MQRFALTYQPEKSYEAYSQLQVRTTDRDSMFKVLAELDKDLANEFEQPTFQFKLDYLVRHRLQR